MLLQIKVYLIATIYLLGALFMYLFPPRNFDMSGAKLRTRRSVDDNLKFNKYVDYNTLWLTLKEFAQRDPEVINLIQLTPPTSENRSIFAVELRSDRQSRKPGIFIIGGLDAMAWGASNAILELTQKLLYDASYQTPFFNDYDWSGAKLRTRRSVDDNLKFNKYVDYNTLWLTLKEFAQRDPEVINLIQLTPPTSENRSIFAVELRSDRQSRKPGIFIIGGLDAMAWGASNAILELTQKLLYDASYQTPFFNDYDWSGAKLRTRRSVDDNLKFNKYVDYNTLWLTLKEFAQRDPEVINLIQLTPPTSENRSIFAVELRSDRQSRKPGIFIIGGLDAMAWGASNAILELTQKLLYDASYQTPFFNDYDWYLIPMANPDGIAFTQSIYSLSPLEGNQLLENTTTRQLTRPLEWHKNVDNQVAKSSCFGTNINRNFAYHWQDDVTKTPKRCSQSYPGERPFCTAEAKATRQYVDGLGENIGLAIHLHVSFVNKKEYILYPWRYSLRQPSNYRTLQEIGEYAARKARLPDGRLYEVHQSSSDERIAGTLADYMSGVVGTDLVFIIKPHHPMFPNFTDTTVLGLYVQKSITSVLSVVRGWRSSTKQNTLHFFGKEIEF